MRFPFAPLERMLLVQSGPRLTSTGQHAGATARVADAMGVSLDRVVRWRVEGLSPEIADRVAVAAGFHPCELWPDWYEYEDRTCGLDGCDVPISPRQGYCCSVHKSRAAVARTKKNAGDPKNEIHVKQQVNGYAEADNALDCPHHATTCVGTMDGMENVA